jgi:hypothetical protein
VIREVSDPMREPAFSPLFWRLPCRAIRSLPRDLERLPENEKRALYTVRPGGETRAMPLSAKASGAAGVLSRARRAITVARRPRGLESCACVLLQAHFRDIKLGQVQGHSRGTTTRSTLRTGNFLVFAVMRDGTLMPIMIQFIGQNSDRVEVVAHWQIPVPRMPCLP